MSGFRRPPRHLPPEPNVVRLIPPPTDPELPVPNLVGTIAPDQELDDAHRFDIDEAYRLAAWTWGHEFGVSWAAYVAGLPLGHRWTMRQVRQYLFLQWLHKQGRS